MLCSLKSRSGKSGDAHVFEIDRNVFLSHQGNHSELSDQTGPRKTGVSRLRVQIG